MGETESVLLAFVILLWLLSVRIPVALSLLCSGAIGLYIMQDVSFTQMVIGRNLFESSSRYVLIIIPMFLLLSVFARRGTIARDAFVAAARVTRRIPGGLAVACVIGCAGLSAISGSSVATSATMGPIAIPQMVRAGYSVKIAAGVVAIAGTLGVLIPPSIALVLYAIITGESVGQLLLAGVIPGIITAAGYSLALIGRAKLTKSGLGQSEDSVSIPSGFLEDDTKVGNEMKPNGGVNLFSLLRVGVLFLVVVGGIYSGLFTATESAAVGAIITLIFFILDIRKSKNIAREIYYSFREAASTTSSIMFLLVGASIFTFLVVYSGVPAAFTSAVLGLEIPATMVLILLLLAFVPLGMILDPLSMLLIAVPLAYPPIIELGFDGVWFGILVVKLVEVGLVTPPVGLNAFVVSGSVKGVTVEDTFKGIMWLLPVEVAIIGLLIAIPELVTWLPQTML